MLHWKGKISCRSGNCNCLSRFSVCRRPVFVREGYDSFVRFYYSNDFSYHSICHNIIDDFSIGSDHAFCLFDFMPALIVWFSIGLKSRERLFEGVKLCAVISFSLGCLSK